MSTYYYLICHDCKVSCDAARIGRAGPGHFINSDVDVPKFIFEHCGHRVAIVSEYSEERAGYRDFNSPEPKPLSPEEESAQAARLNGAIERFWPKLTPEQEQERGYILNTVGPGRYIIVVPKALRDEIMEKHQFKDEDVPGLITPAPFSVPTAETRRAPYIQPRPLPYPPRIRGRYAR